MESLLWFEFKGANAPNFLKRSLLCFAEMISDCGVSISESCESLLLFCQQWRVEHICTDAISWTENDYFKLDFWKGNEIRTTFSSHRIQSHFYHSVITHSSWLTFGLELATVSHPETNFWVHCHGIIIQDQMGWDNLWLIFLFMK